MIGSGLIRFHPHTQRPEDGHGLTDTAWKTLKAVGPTLLRDVITAAATEGVKGNQVNWMGGLTAAKPGAKGKSTQELTKLVTKKARKSIFGF